MRRLLTPFEEFVRSESIGGLTLIAAALVAFLWANSPLSPSYFVLRETYLGFDLGCWGTPRAPCTAWSTCCTRGRHSWFCRSSPSSTRAFRWAVGLVS
jgi:Na+/H+ antiporter 1